MSAADPTVPAGTAPPTARRVPHEHSIHGHVRTDDYHWLRERGSDDVLAYLEAENAYTDALMASTKPLQETLYEEMVARIQEDDTSVPVRRGEWEYFARTYRGLQYPVYFRRPVGSADEAAEETLLDPNVLAHGGYLRVGVLAASPDHSRLAYSLDRDGSELFTLHVKDLRTGAEIGAAVPNTAPQAVWGEDGETLYYVTRDDAMRPDKVWRHRVGSDPSADSLVYHEPEGELVVHLAKSKSRRFIVLTMASQVTSEVRFFDAADPTSEPKLVAARRKGHEYSVVDAGDRLLILTNDRSTTFRMVEAPVERPGEENCGRSSPRGMTRRSNRSRPSEGSSPCAFDATDSAGSSCGVTPTATSTRSRCRSRSFALGGGDQPDFERAVIRFEYSSLVTPRTVVDYDLETRDRTVLKRYAVLGGYDPSNFHVERLTATAPDGVAVPISLVARNDLGLGPHPLLLTGYGSYGISYDPAFVPTE